MLYRCAAPSEFEGLNRPRATARPPGNVPYLVDNLWAWLRPPGRPDRRHAVFASPTPELARLGATPAGATQPSGRVGRVEIAGVALALQLPQRDARDHPDVATLRRRVVEALGPDWLAAPAANKSDSMGRLFLPLLSAVEVAEALRGDPALAEALREASTFWRDAQPVPPLGPPPYPEGEVFFHAPGGWRLLPLE